MDRFIEQIDSPDVDLQRTLLAGSVSTEIKNYAEETDTDLVVLTSQGVTNLVGQYIGSTTRRILQTVKRPILVVPTPD